MKKACAMIICLFSVLMTLISCSSEPDFSVETLRSSKIIKLADEKFISADEVFEQIGTPFKFIGETVCGENGKDSVACYRVLDLKEFALHVLEYDEVNEIQEQAKVDSLVDRKMNEISNIPLSCTSKKGYGNTTSMLDRERLGIDLEYFSTTGLATHKFVHSNVIAKGLGDFKVGVQFEKTPEGVNYDLVLMAPDRERPFHSSKESLSSFQESTASIMRSIIRDYFDHSRELIQGIFVQNSKEMKEKLFSALNDKIAICSRDYENTTTQYAIDAYKFGQAFITSKEYDFIVQSSIILRFKSLDENEISYSYATPSRVEMDQYYKVGKENRHSVFDSFSWHDVSSSWSLCSTMNDEKKYCYSFEDGIVKGIERNMFGSITIYYTDQRQNSAFKPGEKKEWGRLWQ